jgi:hypothetical protein
VNKERLLDSEISILRLLKLHWIGVDKSENGGKMESVGNFGGTVESYPSRFRSSTLIVLEAFRCMLIEAIFNKKTKEGKRRGGKKLENVRDRHGNCLGKRISLESHVIVAT